jgi:signal transduction histidine kinase
MTLQRRAERLIHFVDEQANKAIPISKVIYQFSLVSPEGDLLGVTDVNGRAIYRSSSGSMDIPWPSEICERPCFRMTTYGQRRMRIIQEVITLRGQPYRLTLAGQIDEHYDILRMVRNSYLISIPLLLLISVIGGLILADRTLQPIGRMTRTAQTISIRDLRKRLPVPNTGDEIQHLAITWNELLGRLESAVYRLTQFTSDISHDLRTTLTVMSATAQVTTKRERTPTEYQQALQIIASECESTTQLLDDLLAASRAEAANQGLSLSLVPISEVVEESCSALQGRAQVKRQELFVEIEADRWVIGNQSLIRRLITILVDNAVKYTPHEGAIRVSLCSDNDGTFSTSRTTALESQLTISTRSSIASIEWMYPATASREVPA